MRNRKVLLAVLLALALRATFASCQQITVRAENGKQTVLSRTDIEALPHVRVATSASSTSATFEGTSLKAVLERGGVEFGEMKGKQLASCLLVGAADGYQVVIALPEIDSAFTDKQFILAFLKDGKPLDDKGFLTVTVDKSP